METFTIYDDRDILFVNRVVMGALVGKGIASTQTEAWNIMRKALKSCLDQPATAPSKVIRQHNLRDFGAVE